MAVTGVKRGVARGVFEWGLALGGGEPAAVVESFEIAGHSPSLGFFERGLQILLQIRRKSLVIKSIRGVGGQVDRVSQAVAAVGTKSIEIEHGRDQSDAVERDSLVDQASGKTGRAHGSV